MNSAKNKICRLYLIFVAILILNFVSAEHISGVDDESELEHYAEIAVKLEAIEVAKQVDEYILDHPDMTLEDISKVGESVTQELDEDANVIWGARISNDMKGKLMVMTIITGVQSPTILGKAKEVESTREINEELGIEIIH